MEQLQHTNNIVYNNPPVNGVTYNNAIVNIIKPNKGLYMHVETGNIGTFIKEYYPTTRPLTMQIQLSDGRIFFAPKSEFIKLS